MGEKKVFYLDPDERKWTMKDLGLDWDDFLAVEDDEKKPIEGIFFANNRKIIEWFEVPNFCLECLDPLSYNDEYDSSFCKACNEWRDGACGDPNCEFCLSRPDKPSDCN